MIALICFVLAVLASPFKSKSRLEAENAALRHQLIVLRRKMPGRPWLTNNDRWFFLQMYRWFPSILKVVRIIQPETLVRWHRAGFRCYWRWKSLGRGGRPQIETELRALIRRMSIENPLWGAPRIHGELLKLGLAVAQSSVAKYMVKRRGPPSQGWCTFLHNHAPDIAAMDLFVVPTIGFKLLYAFVIVRLNRRDLVWINVTTNPNAEWIARQITEAFPWNEARQRCADLAASSADRRHHFKSDPWRTSSLLHPNLGFRYTQASGSTLPRSARGRRRPRAATLWRASFPTIYVDVVDEERGRVRRFIDGPAAAERKVNERIQRTGEFGRSRLTPDRLTVAKENDGLR